jgi:hypothetical protein
MALSSRGRKPRVKNVRVDRVGLTVELVDGRTLTVPLDWFPRLRKGTPAERRRWEPCAGGTGIHWPDLDEDLSLEGLLRGTPAA